LAQALLISAFLGAATRGGRGHRWRCWSQSCGMAMSSAYTAEAPLCPGPVPSAATSGSTSEILTAQLEPPGQSLEGVGWGPWGAVTERELPEQDPLGFPVTAPGLWELAARRERSRSGRPLGASVRPPPGLDVVPPPPASAQRARSRQTAVSPGALWHCWESVPQQGGKGWHAREASPRSQRTSSPPLVWDGNGDFGDDHELAGAKTPPRRAEASYCLPLERPAFGSCKPSQRLQLQAQRSGAPGSATAPLPPHGMSGQPQPQVQTPMGSSAPLSSAALTAVARALAAVGAGPPIEGPPPTTLASTPMAQQGAAPSSLGGDVCQVCDVPAKQQDEQQTNQQQLSLGSIGHPHSCGAACRFVKRKSGCRDGIHCTSCHLCFWRRDSERDDEKDVPPPPAPPEGVPEAQGDDEAVEGPTSFSVGTQGHPHNCGPACRYVRRKKGCRNGLACTNCHKCFWRRDEQRTTAVATPPGLLDDSKQTLQGLVHLYLKSCIDGGAENRAEIAESVAEVEPRMNPERHRSPGASGLVEQAGCTDPFLEGPLERELDDAWITSTTMGLQTSEVGGHGNLDPPSIGSVGHPHFCKQACKYYRKASGCKDGNLCSCCHLCRWRRKPKPSPSFRSLGEEAADGMSSS